jgi:uncharacterized protein (DUF58 family)
MDAAVPAPSTPAPERRRDRRSALGRVRAWVIGRHAKADTLTLNHRNVYILPTRAGLVFAATVVVLLLASINYQLNLGYVLTFLLAGSAVVSMHVTHNTLRGLTLHLRPPQPGFAGEPVPIDVVLTNPGQARFGVSLRMGRTVEGGGAWVDVAAGAQAPAQLSFVPAQRGRRELPAVQVETRFPLGLFRAWAIWRPATPVLVYPAPEAGAPALPPARPSPGGDHTSQRSTGSGDLEGIRAYRRGDSPRLIVWKKAIKALEGAGELPTRDHSSPVRQQRWLDWSACAPLAPEDRLGRLTAWVLAADRQGVDYGLALPGRELPFANGATQRRACLEALALWS